MEHAEKREAVLQAALELVGERGFHGSPMALIAERAGVAAGTIYRFFDGKDDLIREVYAWVEGRLLAVVAEGYPAEASARDRFLHVGRRLVAHFIATPLQFRFLEQFHNSPYGTACKRDKALGKKDRNLVVALLEEARDRGAAKDLPLPILTALAFGPLIDICRDHILEFVALDDRLIELTVGACWDAIRQAPEDPAGLAAPPRATTA